jgi:DNA-binding CsgD family transcriptional regulator
VARLNAATQGLLRLAAAAGRDVGYPLLRAVAVLPERDLRGSLRQAVEHGVLVADQATGSFRFRHALLAEAIYATILPGERAELHARLAGLCAWAAELAGETGAAPRAVELARRAIELVGDRDPLRAALLHECLGVYLHAAGRTYAGLAAFERAVELVPAQPPSPERAPALAALGTGLALAWRFDESLAVCEQALAAAVGAPSVELRALTVLGSDLAYLGRGDEGLARLGQALRLAEERGDPTPLQRVYITLTDVLMMLGRPRESARLAATGLDVLSRYGIDSTVLVANQVEALLASGEWDRADSLSATAIRASTASYPYMLLILRADIEFGRGDFDAARAHLDAASATLREDRALGLYDASLAELALWERRWADADQAVGDAWERLQHPPLVAYCRWRQAEALAAAGASRAEASRPLREAHALAARMGATPLVGQLQLLAQRARLELGSPDAGPPDQAQGLGELLGLTPREAEVLALIARGCTNREIAVTLVISVRTAGVHVSHILRELGAPNRLEAAAIAHRAQDMT